MADGTKFGRVSGFGYVAHTDTSATPVASVTIPTTPDGYYKVYAEVWGGDAAGANMMSAEAHCLVRVDAGALTVQEISTPTGPPTYTIGFSISGSEVRVTVAAVSGHHSGAEIEAYGFELAISVA